MIRKYLRGGYCQFDRCYWPAVREERCCGQMPQRVMWQRSVDGGEGKRKERRSTTTLNKSRSSGRLYEEGGTQKRDFRQELRVSLVFSV